MAENMEAFVKAKRECWESFKKGEQAWLKDAMSGALEVPIVATLKQMGYQDSEIERYLLGTLSNSERVPLLELVKGKH